MRRFLRHLRPYVLAFMVFVLMGANGQIPILNSIVGNAYQPDGQTAAFRTGLTGIDTATVTAYLATTEFVLGNSSASRQNVSIGGRFSSGVAGTTVGVSVLYVWKNASNTNVAYALGPEITLTARATVDASSKSMSSTFLTDGFGATALRIVVTTAPSAGNVDLWVGSY